MNTFSSSIPLLHPVTLHDWLEKLGEKALLAWLQFHSWKAEETQEHQPFCFRNSLNQIIKKLKIGKATFYHKILEPLIHYGLIDLKPTENANRETHLVLYSFPQNCPEKALLPLNPVKSDCQINDEKELLPTLPPSVDECPSELTFESFSPTPNGYQLLIHDLTKPHYPNLIPLDGILIEETILSIQAGTFHTFHSNQEFITYSKSAAIMA